MRSRIVLILIVLTGLWIMMLGRAAYLQVVPDGRLKALQKRQFETTVTLNPRRGDVIDRNGHELAVSMTSYSLFADPKIIEEPKKVARILAKQLNVSTSEIARKIKNRKKRFVWLRRHVDKSVYDEITALKIRGLGFIEESKRIYPNEKLLSHVLGFVGGEEQGLEGLELSYNKDLQATEKRVSVRRDARGRPLIVNGQVFTQVPDGADVQLTIDRELQFIVEQELAQAVEMHEAESAVGVVLDAQTSEVLAMASVPSFDPNRAFDFSPSLRRNRAVTDSFEPGSTMKAFVVAGALSRGLIEPNTKFNCEGGVMRIGRRTIREADKKHSFDILTVSQILALSSNVGTTKIALKLGDEALLQTLQSFGFGEKLGIDLPGEARGIIHSPPWRDHLLANVSFGHGMTATPLQIANGYAAIANGGVLRQPYVVKSIRDHESGEVVKAQPKEIRRVLSEEHAAKMRLMLTAVTSDGGTGLNARVPGFPVAGKTGTAQKVNPNGRGYLPRGYISSFAGFLPANDPRFVIFIAVDHPRKGYYGSAVAAPVFSRVAKFAVRRAGLAPVLITEENVVPHSRIAAEIAELNTKSQPKTMNPSEAIDAVAGSDNKEPSFWARLLGQKARNEEPASRVVSQVLASEPLDSTLPELKGLSLREVLAKVSESGVELKIHGQGYVTRTLPSAGTDFKQIKRLTIYLEP